jgi:3-hydroxyisobutyrate dehydrogenase-like beta-hydroxyacid dehydrogenase
MVGGESQAVRACTDLFEAFARQTFHVGPRGSGARMKLVVNLVLGLNRAVLAEGLSFARALGLDAIEALAILKAGPTFSRVMETKGQKMLERDFEPQARLAQHRKDVELMLAAAKRAGAAVPLSALHLDLLRRVEAAGLGGADNSAIIEAFDRRET